MLLFNALPVPFLKKKLKERPQFRKMKVPGLNKLYFIVHSVDKDRFNRVLIWLDMYSIYGFALHISNGDLYVIVAENGPFEEHQVVLFLKTLGTLYGLQSAHVSTGVQYQIYNHRLP
ncbi:hypothetical protein I302_105325 [Kwoniella bestiolae CBS 10118]|uniref:Uncharacterized protein n=1 Tax=Kwoniella bestiolae CBS 10118 TaxID=1296100 RepID=A0A1B9FSU2_9TREE|nr:hypothetical protein I302_08611 [Kwoniella bestiolae CBS 10118]OCF21832.1 hypothetical protein I302_08611 [Kwoniella bestiolae CBS 10118]